MEKKNHSTLAVREGALCAGRLVRVVPVRSVRFPCNGHGRRSPDRSPPICALGGGGVLHAARQTVVVVVARGGCVGGPEGRGRRRRRPPKGDDGVDGDDGGRSLRPGQRGRGERAARKGVRDRKPKVIIIMIAEMRKTKCGEKKKIGEKKIGREEMTRRRCARPPEADKNIIIYTVVKSDSLIALEASAASFFYAFDDTTCNKIPT